MYRFVVLALAVAAVNAGYLSSPLAGTAVATSSIGYGGLASPYGLGLRSGLVGSPYGYGSLGYSGYAAPYSAGYAAPYSAGYAAPYSAGYAAPYAGGYASPLGLGLHAPLAGAYNSYGYGLNGHLVH